MTHDLLCPSNVAHVYPATATIGGVPRPVDVTVRSGPCQCDLIAKVRADERGEDGKEDDRKAERDKVAREILDSETFMWLMAGSEREAYYLGELRRAYLAYCKDLDGGYGRWADRQRNKPWLNKEADRGDS